MNKKDHNKDYLQRELNLSINEKIVPVLKVRVTKHLTPTDIAALVHKLRVALKRLQALWYLVVPLISEVQYKQQKKKVVAACKALGVTRDEEIKRVTLERLLENVSDANDKVIMINIYKIIQKRPINYSLQAITNAQKVIKAAVADFKKLHIQMQDIEKIKKRIHKSLNKTQKLFLKIKKDPTDKKIHGLRKSCKTFLYQVCFLKEKFPEKLHNKILQLDELQEMLGFIHDLSVTEDFILSHPHYFTDKKCKKAFAKCIDRRKKDLKKRSLSLADKLFVDSYSKFSDGIEKLDGH